MVGIMLDMCDLCDGATRDEMRFWMFGTIERHGWGIQYVEVQPVSRAWAYTIGLSAGFGHPELVVVGLDPDTAGAFLNWIGEMIRDGERFAGTEVLIVRGKHIHFSEVHQKHFERGLLTSWDDYYESLGGTLPERRALEIVLPGNKPRLATPGSTVGSPAVHRPPAAGARRGPKRRPRKGKK